MASRALVPTELTVGYTGKAEEDDLEASSEEQLDFVEHSKVRVKVEHSTYGAGILAVAQSSDELYNSTHGPSQACGRLANGMGLFVTAAVIQAILAVLILLFSNERMQDPYERMGSEHMAHIMREAMATNTSLPKTDPVLKLCIRDHTIPWSQSLVVFLWLCRSSPLLFTAFWGLYVIWHMPTSAGQHNLESDATLDIVCLPRRSKFFLVLFVKLPTIAIELALIVAGMKFLMYCNALGALILKAMGMAYILTIPSIVFSGLASGPLKAEVDKTHLVAEVPFVPAWDVWVSGACKTILHLGITIWFCRIHHAGLQDFRMACFQYKYQFVFPVCNCGLSFFGLRLAN
mmetsp:Transcript_66167/g.147035  ORF Transcript_66167/g.147035 Transcript_66167/m.147035 type:complete len:346 (-) Transcript_66167:63-1100(-)